MSTMSTGGGFRERRRRRRQGRSRERRAIYLLPNVITSASLLLGFWSHSPFWLLIFSTAIALIVIAKHHTNIARIVNGTESRFP